MDPQLASLQSYISQQLQLGQTPDAIAQQLQAANWHQEIVHQAFAAVQAGMVPTSMQPAGSLSTQLPEAAGTTKGRIRNGWLLFKTSVKILNGNRYLLRYMAETWAGVIVANVIFILIGVYGFQVFTGDGARSQVALWTLIFLNYVVIYFIINFFAAALAKNIMDIFKGVRQEHSVYTKAARSKTLPILVFSIIESIVGMILRYLVERIRFIGWIISYILGTAWSLGTMFVLPIIIETDTPALPAIKQSIHFFKQTWGEGITAKLAVNTPLLLPAIVLVLLLGPILYAAALIGTWAGIVGILVWLIAAITLAILGSFANSIVNVALYYYATNQLIPPGFSAEMLNSVFIKRQHRFIGKKSNNRAT
jgi:hypothetical protein